QGNVLQVAYAAQQPLRLGLQTETAEMAGHVIGGFARAASADVLDAEHVDHEIGEFMGAVGQIFRSTVPDQVVVKQLRIFEFYHGGARAGRGNNKAAVIRVDYGVACQDQGMVWIPLVRDR